MKIKLLLLLLLVAIGSIAILPSCTENQRARTFGGTSHTDIPVGQKLINVTWKDAELWILTEKAEPNYIPKEYTFYEESSYGLMEGTVIIREHK
jgi:hypothetical protein